MNILFKNKVPADFNFDDYGVAGLYNHLDDKIYVLDSIDLNSIEGKAVLAHEAVHYLQYKNGKDKEVRCKNELEKTAYAVQERYLNFYQRKHNVTPTHISLVSACWWDFY